MKTKATATITAMGLILGACSSSPEAPEYYTEQQKMQFDYRAERAEHTMDNTPDWYTEQPSGESLVANATARSYDMQMAMDKATLDAKRILAEALSGRLSGKIKTYAEEHSIDDVFTQQSSKVVISTFNEVQLSGSRVVKHEILPEGDGYRAFVQMTMAQNDANKIMTAHLRTKAKTTFDKRAKAAYEKLEAEIQNMGLSN